MVALEFARTFWEKATILHAEFHRPPAQPIRDRFARHYSDFAALWRHPRRDEALSRMDLLRDVIQHKSRFFSSGWANYAAALPGSFRLVPPIERHASLTRDYMKMAAMFLTAPPPFSDILQQLADAESKLNTRS